MIPFKTGVIDDRVDDRDFIYEDLVGGGEPFDWNKGYDVEEEISDKLGKETKLKVENQGRSLSCVGQGISKYAEVLNVFDESILRDFSAKDIYQPIRHPNGCAMISNGMKWLVEHGVEEEQYVQSYDNGKPPTEAFMASQVARNEERAKQFRALSYLTTTHNDIDYLAMMIRDNHGIVSSYIGSNKGWTSKILTKPTSQDFSHCVYFGKAKLIDGVKRVIFLNSGGEAIGDRGWQAMGKDYFGYLKNIWTVRDLLTNNKKMKLIREKGRPETFAVINGQNYYIGNTDTFNDLEAEGHADWSKVEEVEEPIQINGIITR
jgi:hypothetical protein